MAEETTPDGEQQEQVDWKAKYEEAKSHSRKWEDRAKENKARADSLEAGQSDLEKTTQKVAELEQLLAAQTHAALVSRVQASHGITDEDAALFLTGSDEDTLKRQAARLADRGVESKKQGNVARTEGDPKTDRGGRQDQEMREYARNLFAAANQD